MKYMIPQEQIDYAYDELLAIWRRQGYKTKTVFQRIVKIFRRR